MRFRKLVLVALALAAIAALAGAAAVANRKLFYTRGAPLANPIPSPAATQTYLIILGAGDKAAAIWDGPIAATGANVIALAPWRFAATDAITGTASWKITTREAPAGPNETGTSLFQENGVIATISPTSGPISITVTTANHGSFTFAPSDIPLGTGKPFPTNRALVQATATPLQLTSDL